MKIIAFAHSEYALQIGNEPKIKQTVNLAITTTVFLFFLFQRSVGTCWIMWRGWKRGSGRTGMNI